MRDSWFGTPTRRPSGFSFWSDWAWLLGLFVAALVLYLINLGGLPLRDWDEGTYADVARSIWRSPPEAMAWLFPVLRGVPFSDKPPLVPVLMAGTYALGGLHEWTARLSGALLTACSVPLLYALGRELVRPRAALLAAGVYLTMLPVVRHGRLAMLDGAVLCFALLMAFCLVRARRSPVWALGAGLGFALIALTKGVLGLLFLALFFVYLALDNRRLLASGWLWGGLLVGFALVGGWYAAQYFHYGWAYLAYILGAENFARVVTSVERSGGPPWYYLVELLKYGWPWLLFVPQSLTLAWRERRESWARLVGVWALCYFAVISASASKLPWYVLPLYPALALALGVYLDKATASHDRRTPKSWVFGLAFVAFAGLAGSVYFGLFAGEGDRDLLPTLLAVFLTALASVVLVLRDRPLMPPVLCGGLYVALVLFFSTGHWIWELNETYPVRSVAELVGERTPPGQTVYTSFPSGRPSLDFYSDRTVLAVPWPELLGHWQGVAPPYLLVDANTLAALTPTGHRVLGEAEGLLLVTRAGQPLP
jgi:4-amino-4-deoxy-L-arabinose transferase-like glycosyltransferase